MRTSRLTRLAWPLATAMLFLTSAQAMEIRQFDKMDDRDQGAETVLSNEGRADLAAQVDKLFLTIPVGDKMSLGMTEFEKKSGACSCCGCEACRKDPNAARVEVEDAMAVTLQKNGIELPDSFFTVNSNFHPKFPPK